MSIQGNYESDPSLWYLHLISELRSPISVCVVNYCFLIFTTASVINISVRSLVRVRAKTGCLGTRYVYQRTVVSVSYQSKGPIKCVGLVQSRHHHHPHLIKMYLVLGSVIIFCSTSGIHRVKCKNKFGNKLYSVISQNWGNKIRKKQQIPHYRKNSQNQMTAS